MKKAVKFLEKLIFGASGGKFEIFRGEDGKWHFNLKAVNHEIVCHGEGYESKQSCVKGIRAIKNLAKRARVIEK